MSGSVVGAGSVLLERDDPTRQQLLDDLAAMQRARCWAEAAEQGLLAQLDAWRPPRFEGHEPAAKQWERDRWLREDVSAIMRVASPTAGGRMAAATKLVEHLPGVLEAMEFGQLGFLHARAALEAAAPLDATQCAAFEQRVLKNCDDVSAAEFRARCRRAVIAVDPGGAERRHERARAERRFGITGDEDGMATLYSAMTTADAARVKQHVDARTDHIEAADGEQRTRDQIRADVVVDLLTGDDAASANGHARAPVEVIIPFTTLVGADDQPCRIDGEPVVAALARDLVSRLVADPNAWWRPALVDRGGYLEAVGARTYEPAAALRRLTKLRDRTCRFPGCRRNAARCEVDHVEPFDRDDATRGGLTVAENLECLCKRHHRMKHEAGWKVVCDGTYTTWSSPDGFGYTKVLEALVDPPPF